MVHGTVLALLAVLCMCNGTKSFDFRNMSCTEWLCPVDDRTRMKATCHCDDKCSFLGDCCEEFPNVTKPDTRGTVWNYMQCTHHCLVSTLSFFFAVTSCPQDANRELQDLCTISNSSDLLSQIPATGKSSGLLYRNIFCAKCHNEEADPWQLYVYCYKSEAFNQNITHTFKDLLKMSNCGTGIQQPAHVGNIRRCQPDVVSTCPRDSELGESCEDGVEQIVFTENGTYRNPACAECNSQTSFKCSHRVRPTCNLQIILASMYSLTLLFDFGTSRSVQTISGHVQSVQEEEKVELNCSSSEIYDPFLETCRKVSCASTLEFIDDKCHTPKFFGSVPVANKILTCPTIVLNESEFTILQDGRLMHLASLLTHDQDQFILNGSRALLCTSAFNSIISPIKPSFSTAEGIVSGTGMILSEIGLFFTISVYTLLKPLRNIPGCNLMCLSISLFLAELCMLVAPTAENLPEVCKGLAVGMHYFFLTAFMWMNMISFDLRSTFARTINMAWSGNRFTAYSACSWMVPTVPVITAIVIDTFLPRSPLSPNYGQGVCWISNPLALAVFFAGPLALIILINSILFVITSVNICRVKSSTGRKLGREDKSQFLIYIKLFLVMGLTWIFGFLSAFVPHLVLRYLYIILNSLQGLLIAVSFLCTRKVFRLLGKKFCGPRESTTSSIRLSSISSNI